MTDITDKARRAGAAPILDRLARGVLRVGDGRGFVVKRRNASLNYAERIVVTAAHCLPGAFPPPHPARYLYEETYQRLLGPLGSKPTVWARCLFVDPIADIAVLGQPDYQALAKEANAYDRLVEGMTALKVADAPPQGVELVEGFGGHKFKTPTPGKGPARVLSLAGRWLDGQVERREGYLGFEPEHLFVGGMSGSPIINEAGAAIAVVSVDIMCPVIVDSLSAQLVRSIKRTKAPRGPRHGA